MMALAGALTLLAVRSGRVTSRAVGVSFPHLSIHPGLPLTGIDTGAGKIRPRNSGVNIGFVDVSGSTGACAGAGRAGERERAGGG